LLSGEGGGETSPQGAASGGKNTLTLHQGKSSTL
jgi:hypothetical protein